MTFAEEYSYGGPFYILCHKEMIPSDLYRENPYLYKYQIYMYFR